jgi:SAM-dependent methyltransferase
MPTRLTVMAECYRPVTTTRQNGKYRPLVADHPVFAAAYDRMTAPMERKVLAAKRRQLLARARGHVLEIGAGTGANLAHYPTSDAITTLELAEPDGAMRRRLATKVAAAALPFPVFLSDAGAEGPFPSPPYDTIVSTLVLCTVPDPAAAIASIVGALAEGGEVLYIEHVADGGLKGRGQRLLNRPWGTFAGGCRLDRDTLATMRAGGLFTAEQDWLPLPFPLSATTMGMARHRLRDGVVTPTR